MTDMVAAMSLQPGDVAHIETHTCHGYPVNCGTHNVEVTAIRWGDEAHEDVVIDYDPWAMYPGDVEFRHGTVVYDRLARLAVLWHGALEAIA